MRLDEGDEVVSLDMAEPGATLLAVSELGYGKRTHVDEYRLTRRGGKGIITMRITDKNGPVVGVRRVADDEDIMLITDGGKVIRTPVKGISVMGRATQGVRLIDLNEGEKVVGVARLAEKEEDDTDPAEKGADPISQD
jgi:DNA gyrase subunit A